MEEIPISILAMKLVYAFKVKIWLIRAEERYKKVTERLQSDKNHMDIASNGKAWRWCRLLLTAVYYCQQDKEDYCAKNE